MAGVFSTDDTGLPVDGPAVDKEVLHTGYNVPAPWLLEQEYDSRTGAGAGAGAGAGVGAGTAVVVVDAGAT